VNDGNEEKEPEEEKDNVDQQLRQLKENYGHMSEGELCKLAENAYKLTDIAREALQAVITERGITIGLKLEPPAPPRAEPPEDDEGLINIGFFGGWPHNAEEARFTMGALSAAGIPSFLGPDNDMHLEEFRGRFDGTVSLKVRDVDWDRALLALERARDAFWRDYKEEDPEEEEEKDYAILCPKCRSAKVVLKGRDTGRVLPQPMAKFQWSCDACGHRWVDDGITQEADGGQSWPGEEFSSRRGPFRRVDPKWSR
jgi:DNA-directed RNA polymerase subunit M/transcription elongation factor TFIIS